MNIRILALSVVALMVVSSSAFAQAPVTASQKYTVNVPTVISITAPSDVSLTHDQSDNNQIFPTQSWLVKGNTLAGVSVTFATNQAFTHTTNANYKRNAKLDLSLGATSGPAIWSITTPSDTTNYAVNDGVAQVAASSNGVGRAGFNLSVTFITDQFGSFAAGSYETTVTGTVSAN